LEIISTYNIIVTEFGVLVLPVLVGDSVKNYTFPTRVFYLIDQQNVTTVVDLIFLSINDWDGVILCIVSSQGRESRPASERRPESESDAIHLFLNEEQGYYEIGLQLEDNNIFVLSVTIGLASNLAKVNCVGLNSSFMLF